MKTIEASSAKSNRREEPTATSGEAPTRVEPVALARWEGEGGATVPEKAPPSPTYGVVNPPLSQL